MNNRNEREYQGWQRRTISTRDAEERVNWVKKLTLNKWSLTFAVMLVMFSAWLGLEEVDRNMASVASGANMTDGKNYNAQDNEVLYVTDTIPYDIQRVNAEVDANKESEKNNEKNSDEKNNNEQNNNNSNGETNGENNETTANLAEQGEPANYSINSDSDFFINYRLEREKARSRQLELLQSLIDDEKTTDEMRGEAQHKVIEQAEAIEEELMLESILVAQYGGEAVVFIQPEKVNVVLGLGGSMADKEAEKIARLVDNYTGIGFENVIIVLKD